MSLQICLADSNEVGEEVEVEEETGVATAAVEKVEGTGAVPEAAVGVEGPVWNVTIAINLDTGLQTVQTLPLDLVPVLRVAEAADPLDQVSELT